MTKRVTFRKIKVSDFLSYEEEKLEGFIYLTEGQEIPTEPDYIQNYLHILTNEGDKKYYLYVDRGEYQSDNLEELEGYLFDWAKGEYHDGDYEIVEVKERSIHNQFPEFDDKEGFTKLLLGLANYDFVDACWHNEAMPQMAKAMPTEKYPDRELRIWMDWKNQEHSEFYHDAKEGETYYRFNVHLQGEYGDSDTTEFQKDFETMEEVLEFVKDYFESNVAKWTPLHDEWNEWLGKQDNIDNKKADAQEVITCYALTEDQRSFVTDFIERWEQ